MNENECGRFVSERGGTGTRPEQGIGLIRDGEHEERGMSLAAAGRPPRAFGYGAASSTEDAAASRQYLHL